MTMFQPHYNPLSHKRGSCGKIPLIMWKGFSLHRVFIGFLIFLGLFLGSVTESKAGLFDNIFLWTRETRVQEQTRSLQESLLKSENEGIPSQGSHTANTNQFIMLDINSRLLGVDEESLSLTYSPSEVKILTDRYGNGLIGDVGSGIAILYNQPASTKTYVADLLESAHIIPKAQAQGLGFASLDPILESWKIFRNVAYLFFVLIFLIIGFMIMFRQKIGGQTVVTVQQAIPNIVIALVVVTFSYAIAGFLIDMMYLLMYLMIGVFDPAGGVKLLGENILEFGKRLVIGTKENISVGSTVNDSVRDLVTEITFPQGSGPGAEAVGTFLGWISGLTMSLIVSIAILIGVFKIFFELLKTYVIIIILITISPLFLMAGALPGKGNFGAWLKQVFGNLLAFPIVLLALILYEMFTATPLSEGGFMPPFLINRGAGNAIITLVGIGIILIIPDLIKEMKKALKIDGGIWETLAGKAGETLGGVSKGIAPIGGRVVGGVGGAAIGGTIGAAGRIPAALLNRDFGEIITGASKGAGEGVRRGVTIGGTVARSAGARQPDILNPVTEAIDKTLGTEESIRRERALQIFEDAADAMNVSPRSGGSGGSGSSGNSGDNS